jgi:phosphatidylglycerophosphate synthase
VFAAHRGAARDGDNSLAGAVTRLSQDRPIRAVPLPAGSWWQDIDTPDDLRSAKARVRRSLIKESDGPVSRHLNRPISTRISMALAPFRLSPNLISLLTFLVGIWAGWSLSAGRAVVGGLLVQAASVFDGIDGETARLQRSVSARGAFLDGLFDRMVDAAVVAGLFLWWWDDPGRTFRVVIILLSVIGWGLLMQAIKESVSVFEAEKEREPAINTLIGGRDARMLLVALGSLVNQPLVAVIVGGVTYCWPGLWRVASFRRRAKRGSPSRPATPDQVGDPSYRDLEEIG